MRFVRKLLFSLALSATVSLAANAQEKAAQPAVGDGKAKETAPGKGPTTYYWPGSSQPSGHIVTDPSCDCLPNVCCPTTCCEPDRRWSVFADYLYLTARGADVAFGQIRDGVTPLAVPRGAVGVADPDYSSGFRVGASGRIDDNSIIQATYTWWDSDDDDALTAPGPFVIHSLLTFPTTLNAAADSLEASTRYDFELQYVDLDYKHILCDGGCYHVNYLVGARYAHLEQDLNSRFFILGETFVDSSINFDGGGPRIGLEGEYRARRGLFTYSRGIANFIAGHFSATYQQNNVFAGQQALVQFGDDRIVPILELEVGLGWASQDNRFRVSAGYYITSWFNTLTTPGLVQGIQNNNYTTNQDNFRDNLTFDGLAARFEFKF